MCAIPDDGARRVDMRILRGIALFAGLFICTSVQAELINFEEAIEASDITVYISEPGDGYVMARSCRTCKSVRLEITPATIVTVDGKRVPVRENISRD